MSEDRFFQQVNSIMGDYRPEVPQGVYSGMRQKLWWSNFTRFGLTSMNIWYMLLIAGSVAAWFSFGPEASSVQQPQLPSEQVIVSSSNEIQRTEQSSAESPAIPESVKPRSMDVSTQNVSDAVVQSQDVSTQMEPQTVSQNPIETKEPETIETPITVESPQVGDSVKKGSKKGLKVKSYEQTDKK
jgi:hypothetical protein